ncbi:MAG TPA: hypothetical protein VK683_06830 [Rhizomicrobium sp.]|nr:hypothetical protein [Rhizomicrobium sp.]
MGYVLKAFLKDEAGAVAVDHALMVSLIGAAVALAATALGVTIVVAVVDIAASL